ncbi:MAG: hypothetical protein IKY48_07345 [Bacteroidales bacterium]|nr:hypothetical protein [Bacteroidales bacterium]
MISIEAKKHDNFSVEFKFGFNCLHDGVKDDFAVNAWIFVPNSLDINPENYGKSQFYRDVKSNVRLITPVYKLREMAQEDSLPLKSLTSALHDIAQTPNDQLAVDAYEYHLKMFAAIFKSALRDKAKILIDALPDASELIERYVMRTQNVLSRFRALYEIIDIPTVPANIKNKFRMSDEFMSHVMELRTISLIKSIDELGDGSCAQIRRRLAEMVTQEHAYRDKVKFPMLNGEPERDRDLLHHYGMLKKFTESELYIKLDKKKDGVALQQIYYSLAAGVAMVFATAVSWYYQQKYGSVTLPLFIVLVISYMMKDRIKDLLRFYFAHRLGNNYYDKKATIAVGNTKVGEIKEGFDFISETKIPAEVKALRESASFVEGESDIFEEKVLLYRQRVLLDDKALAVKDKYPRKGINEILRLHLYRFVQKMDNPCMTVDTLDQDGNIVPIVVPKIYYVNVIFKLVHDGHEEYASFRIGMSRDGVFEVKRF